MAWRQEGRWWTGRSTSISFSRATRNSSNQGSHGEDRNRPNQCGTRGDGSRPADLRASNLRSQARRPQIGDPRGSPDAHTEQALRERSPVNHQRNPDDNARGGRCSGSRWNGEPQPGPSRLEGHEGHVQAREAPFGRRGASTGHGGLPVHQPGGRGQWHVHGTNQR